MVKKTIRHSYIPDTNIYRSSFEIEEEKQKEEEKKPEVEPDTPKEDDEGDSIVSLLHNRFHLDESVMITYNPETDDLVISARESKTGESEVEQSQIKIKLNELEEALNGKLNVDGTNLNHAVFSQFFANKDFTNVNLGYLKNILELDTLAKKDGSDIDIAKLKDRLGVIPSNNNNNSSTSNGFTREQLVSIFNSLAKKDGSDINVEILRDRLNIQIPSTNNLANIEGTNIDRGSWAGVLGLNNYAQKDGSDINIDKLKERLNITVDTSELVSKEDLKEGRSEISVTGVEAWRNKLNVPNKSDLQNLAKKDGTDIDVEKLKERLRLNELQQNAEGINITKWKEVLNVTAAPPTADHSPILKATSSEIDVNAWKTKLEVPQATDLNPILKATSSEIDTTAWKTKLGITASEIKGQSGIEEVLKATSSDIDVAAWKKLLSEDTVSGDDFE